MRAAWLAEEGQLRKRREGVYKEDSSLVAVGATSETTVVRTPSKIVVKVVGTTEVKINVVAGSCTVVVSRSVATSEGQLTN